MVIDSLLTNEMGLLKKIKDNIPSKVDERNIKRLQLLK